MITEKAQVEFTLTIDPLYRVNIRKERVILDDGKEVNRLFHRQVLEPGDDVSNQPVKIKQICNFLWTAQVIADWNAYKASLPSFP